MAFLDKIIEEQKHPSQPQTQIAQQHTKQETSEQTPSPWPQSPEEEGQLAVDVYQTEHEVVVCSTIAGVKPEHLDVNIENDMVTIRGKREKPEEVALENYFCQECYFGSFARKVVIPVEVNADDAQASLQNGVLTVRLPKLRKKQVKKIEIKTV